MQNNSLSLLATLCLSTAMFVLPVMAQNTPAAAPTPAPSEGATMPAPVLDEKDQERQRLETELSNTQVNSGEILDFPAGRNYGADHDSESGSGHAACRAGSLLQRDP